MPGWHYSKGLIYYKISPRTTYGKKVQQQKGFYSKEQFQIAKAITYSFVYVQKEMCKHRGKLTRGMVYEKVKTNQDLSYKTKRDLKAKLELYYRGQGRSELDHSLISNAYWRL